MFLPSSQGNMLLICQKFWLTKPKKGIVCVTPIDNSLRIFTSIVNKIKDCRRFSRLFQRKINLKWRVDMGFFLIKCQLNVYFVKFVLFFHELCHFAWIVRSDMRFEVNCEKLHHRIISEGLPSVNLLSAFLNSHYFELFFFRFPSVQNSRIQLYY